MSIIHELMFNIKKLIKIKSTQTKKLPVCSTPREDGQT